MDKYLLLVHDEDWADEFNATGFMVVTEKEWEAAKERAKIIFNAQPDYDESKYSYRSGKRPVEYYFGTNEFLEWDTYEEWIKDIKVVKLTDALAATIKSVFKPWMRYGFGIIPYDLGD